MTFLSGGKNTQPYNSVGASLVIGVHLENQ
jgi:hypothetical protein